MSHQGLAPALQDVLILKSGFSYQTGHCCLGRLSPHPRRSMSGAFIVRAPHMVGNCQQSSYTGVSYNPENVAPLLQQQPFLLRSPV